MSIYEEHGCETRNDYIDELAEEYGVDSDIASVMADILGEDEDFDGLVCALEDMWEGYF